MSNIKRSRPEKQDAVLKRFQEISAARVEAGDDEDNDETSTSPALSSDDVNTYENTPLKAGNDDISKKQHKILSKLFDSKLLDIPNLTISSENDDLNISFNKFSPNLSSTNQHIRKGRNPITPGRFSPQPSPPRLRATPPYSPKLSGRFENWPESGAVSSSPTSPSRKYFKLLNSHGLFAGGIRRGSEPLLDGISGRDLNEVKLSMTDRRWEKLRSILVAMKNEPFDPTSSVEGSSSPSMLTSLKENIDTQTELSALRKETSTLHTEIKLKDCELEQALNERNVALSYIRKIKAANSNVKDDLTNSDGSAVLDLNHNDVGDKDSDDGIKVSETGNDTKVTEAECRKVYDRKIEELKGVASSKEDVLNLLVHVVEELRVERSYLNHLMSVVLERAPWMLEEVDKGGHWEPLADDDNDCDDEEVWC